MKSSSTSTEIFKLVQIIYINTNIDIDVELNLFQVCL